MRGEGKQEGAKEKPQKKWPTCLKRDAGPIFKAQYRILVQRAVADFHLVLAPRGNAVEANMAAGRDHTTFTRARSRHTQPWATCMTRRCLAAPCAGSLVVHRRVALAKCAPFRVLAAQANAEMTWCTTPWPQIE
jgi:hypothetical protein